MPRLSAKKTKVFFVPNDPDKGSITIRALSREEMARIESNCVETIADDKGNASMRLNPYARANGIAAACLENWVNFYDEKGESLNYSPKNVVKAARMSIRTEDGNLIRFFEWVDSCHSEFQEVVRKELDDAEKN